MDNAEHTLLYCLLWAKKKGELFRIMGLDADLDRTYPVVVGAIVDFLINWMAVATLCKTIMRSKETAGRIVRVRAKLDREPSLLPSFLDFRRVHISCNVLYIVYV